MFGAAFRVAKAQRACVQALQPFVSGSSLRGPWPPEFWRDPFVLEFFVFAINLIGKLATGDKLASATERGRLFNQTIEALGGNPRDCIDRIEALSLTRDADFALGSRNAETILVYLYNLHPMPDDPDVEMATEMAKGSGLSGQVGRDEIAATLMYMLFTRIAQQRLGAPDRVTGTAHKIDEMCCAAHDARDNSRRAAATSTLPSTRRLRTSPASANRLRSTPHLLLNDKGQKFGVTVSEGKQDKATLLLVEPFGDFLGADVQAGRKGRYMVSFRRPLSEPQGYLATKLVETFVTAYDAVDTSSS